MQPEEESNKYQQKYDYNYVREPHSTRTSVMESLCDPRKPKEITVPTRYYGIGNKVEYNLLNQYR
jgi:hypothetical protein